MALSHPDCVDNVGDAGRVGHVVTHYITFLALDLRAFADWEVWRDRHDLRTLTAVLRRRPPTPDERARMVRVFTETDPADVAIFRRGVAAMRIDRPWVPLLLLRYFQTATWNRLAPPHGRREFSVYFTADAVGHLEKGRKPRYGGWNYQRYVHWHIRRDIKHPPDPPHELEAEYAHLAKRHTPAHSTVIEAIDHVTALLDLVALSPDGREVVVLMKA